MLSEHQIQIIIQKVNEDVDLPFMTDNQEGRIIEKLVRHLIPHVEPSLNVVCGSVYTQAIKTGLNESMPSRQRSKGITALIQGEMSAPLTNELTARIDAGNFLGARLESSLMKLVSNKMIEEAVEGIVDKVDEEIQEELDGLGKTPGDSLIRSAIEIGRADDDSAMLSERQVQIIIQKVNEDVDLPLMSDNREGKIIDKLVRTLIPHLEASLNVVCGDAYTRAIKMALNESMPNKQRCKEVTAILNSELSAPLCRELSERSDAQRFLGARLEGTAMKVVSDKMISEFVEWIVGEVDEEMEEHSNGLTNVSARADY